MRLTERVVKLEQRANIGQRRRILVLTDDHGHRLAPQGEPKRGDVVTEIHVGGLDLERDL